MILVTYLMTGAIFVALVVIAGVVYLWKKPSRMLKLILWILRHSVIRLRTYGKENIPHSGSVLIVSNHVSMIDLLLIQALSPRPVQFMIRRQVLNFRLAQFILRHLGVLEVPESHHPKAMQRFFDQVQEKLRQGGVVCLFPEGKISGNGSLMRFRSSISSFLPPNIPVAVIPVRIGMLEGRLSQIVDGKIKFYLPHSLPITFSLDVGTPVSPDLSAFQLRQRISEIGAIAEKRPQPGEVPIHSAFALRAKRHPFTTTYFDADGTAVLNFEMLVRAVILSKKIRTLSCGDSGYAGVLMPNCTILASLMLGVMYSDLTPAVVNFSAGQDVALEAVHRVGVSVILTSRKFLAKLGWKISPEMIFLEDIAKSVSKPEKHLAILQILLLPRKMLLRSLAPLSYQNLERPAVLLFSSGSTGKPKGVMLTHRNINCDLWAFWRVIAWNRKKDRIIGNLPLFHAYGFTVEFAFPAMSGAPVVYVTNPLDSAGIVSTIEKYQITILTATPTFLQNYLRKARPEQLRSLRLVITGAEKLRPELSMKFRQMTGLEIIEGYGCTELSPIVTINLSSSTSLLGKHVDHPGSIGIPLPGIHVRVIDPDTGEELGPNLPGRMQVKSGIVMKGYLNDPEQSAKVLLHDYYDTGDIARIDPDGYVYLTGRASRFSKIGGEMVPHEIVEDAIAKILGSEECEVAITGRGDARRGERLVVFYTSPTLDPTSIVQILRNKNLPNLWIPKVEDFVKIESLPRLGSGKLDLKRLRQMAEEQLS